MVRSSRSRLYHGYLDYISAVRYGLVGPCVIQAYWNCNYDVNMHDINKRKPIADCARKQEHGA